MSIINAIQANKKSNDFKSKMYLEQEEKIANLILEAANKGYTTAYFYGSIEDNLKSHLEDLGYFVTIHDCRNESETRISW